MQDRVFSQSLTIGKKMFRAKQNNTVFETTEIGGTSTINVGLTPVTESNVVTGSDGENNNQTGGGVSTPTTSGGSFLILDASDSSEQLGEFLDLLNNPCKYKGAIVYLTDVGPTARPDPFLWKDKFYFNEGCEWFESPFALGRILDDLE